MSRVIISPHNKDVYLESHHILPECLGGLDLENQVLLTPEEHYTAHLLLTKIFPHESKLVYAAKMMTIGAETNKRGNKLYGWLRRKFAEKMSVERKNNPVIWTSEMRLAQSLRKKGKSGHPQTQETKDRISTKAKQRGPNYEAAKKTAEKNRGRKDSPETLIKKSLAHDHKPRIVSEEARKRAGQKISAIPRTPESNEKRSIALKGTKKEVVQCPHCLKEGGKPSMYKHHFDNCKQKC